MSSLSILMDSNGEPIARVSIDDETYCEMDLSSYSALIGLGYTGKPGYTKFGKNKYVSYRQNGTTKHILVGRMLAGCKADQICKYRDGNPLNLRLSNLRIV